MGKILLVEPDYILAKTYKEALEYGNHEVAIAPSAQTAVIAADVVEPDAVVLELQLIEHSGIEFLYEFRSYSEWQHIPVIIHTNVPPGEFSGSWKILKEDLGVGLYLYKPKTSLKKLLDSINESLLIEA